MDQDPTTGDVCRPAYVYRHLERNALRWMTSRYWIPSNVTLPDISNNEAYINTHNDRHGILPAENRQQRGWTPTARSLAFLYGISNFEQDRVSTSNQRDKQRRDHQYGDIWKRATRPTPQAHMSQSRTHSQPQTNSKNSITPQDYSLPPSVDWSGNRYVHHQEITKFSVAGEQRDILEFDGV